MKIIQIAIMEAFLMPLGGILLIFILKLADRKSGNPTKGNTGDSGFIGDYTSGSDCDGDAVCDSGDGGDGGGD